MLNSKLSIYFYATVSESEEGLCVCVFARVREREKQYQSAVTAELRQICTYIIAFTHTKTGMHFMTVDGAYYTSSWGLQGQRQSKILWSPD